MVSRIQLCRLQHKEVAQLALGAQLEQVVVLLPEGDLVSTQPSLGGSGPGQVQLAGDVGQSE